MPRARNEPSDASSPPRIVGGELRGRRLAFSPGERTRPMKDRVRETLFDLLGPAVGGAIAIDLFAGTGALGFEAISRGAAKAVFVERHFPTADAIRRSARDLGVEPRVEVRSGDVLLWSRRMPEIDRSAPWLVFVSPPWRFFDATAPEHGALMSLVASMIEAAPPASTIAVESDAGFQADSLPRPEAWRLRELPPAVIHILST